MSTPVPALVVLALLVGLAGPVTAQPVLRQTTPLMVQARAAGGSVHGTVRDEIGAELGDVSVIAMGTVVAAATSDGRGRFVLALPPGEYVLRARRDGYVSTFREPVHISSSALIERNITLVREGYDHSHTDLAWVLRHLRPMVLRDEAPAGGVTTARPAGDVVTPPDVSLFDRMFHETARAASRYLTETDFTGQLNWVTTGSLGFGESRPAAVLAGSVANLSFGAPVGSHGAWSVRGAFSPNEPSSWVLVGEYAARTDERHAFRAGVAYGALRPGQTDPATSSLPITEARTAGSVFGFDRWRVTPDLDVSYGLRFDASDYLAGPPLVSPELGVAVRVVGRLRVTAGVVQRVVAPGAAEFQPPASAGLWMPPDRTFSQVRQAVSLEPERVRSYSFGVDHTFGDGDAARTVGVRRFRQVIGDQVATLFGLVPQGSSHYFVATVGDAEVDGWTVDVSGRLAARLTGSVYYRAGRVSWHRSVPSEALERIAPATNRPDRESLHDLGAALEAELPGRSTRLSLAYRVSTGFQPASDGRGAPAGGRFSIEVRHELPYQPVRGGTFDALAGIRNFYWAPDQSGSIYDELLTISPPIRFVAGIQVRF